MNNQNKLIILIVMIIFSSFFASQIQSNFGSISIEYIVIDNNGDKIKGKLYQPVTASSENPGSAVLVLHGLNNDKDTEGPTSLELAKRGFVVLALDQSGHGDSDRGDNLFKSINSSLGGDAAYKYLKSLSFVKSESIGLVGHSMGGSSANEVAKLNPDHKAIVYQAFTPLNLTENKYLNNYLQLWPKFEESSSLDRSTFIDNGKTMIENNLAMINETGKNEIYDQTYGNFSDGTAQRYQLISSTHPGGTWNSEGIKTVVSWMLQALEGYTEQLSTETSEEQSYIFKELLTLTGLLLLIFSSIPLVDLLIERKYFDEVRTELPNVIYLEGKDWWKFATINSVIGGITYYLIPIFALIGIIIATIIPIFGLFLGSVYTIWFLVNALIAWIFIRRYTRKNNIKISEFGIISTENRLIWRKTLLIAVIVFLYFLLLTSISQLVFKVEFRFMWSFFRIFTPFRFFEFIIYLFPIYLFFKINGGTLLFGMGRLQENKLYIWWLKVIYGWLSGIILLFILFYLPTYLFGAGHFIELAGILWLFSIFLMSIIPEFSVIYLLLIIYYRKTGRIYLGAFISTMIVTWVLSTGVI